MSRLSETIDRLRANSSTPLSATLPQIRSGMVDNTTPLSAKRNRSGVCDNPQVHQPHGTCCGRRRAAKVARPVDPAIARAVEEVWEKYGDLVWAASDPASLGLISGDDVLLYGLDLEKYEGVDFKQKEKFISFFTAVYRTNAIILNYASQNLLPLTLRQIHYQMVVRHKDYPNTKVSYDHLAQDLVVARMAGLVPWNAIDDPTRGLHSFTAWKSAQDRLKHAASTHHLSRWENQEYSPIVLVEKDAALGIISRACDDLDVPYASCKGYGSVSALRNQVAHHCRLAIDNDKTPVVIHLSDHDASGWDMPRNLEEYLDLLVGQDVDMRHIALTIPQIVEGYGNGQPLPPDPVKSTDPRAEKYIANLEENGLEAGAWEMDALPPADLHNLIAGEIKSLRDEDLWKEVEDRESHEKHLISETADKWNNPLPCVGEMA